MAETKIENKLIIIFLILGFVSNAAASSITADSLDAKDVNTTFGSDEIKFQTEDMNISLTPKQVFVPSKINDTISSLSYSVSTWNEDSATSSFDIQYKTIYEDDSYDNLSNDVRRVLGDDSDGSSDLPQNQFIHSSDLYSEDSESKTLVFENNFSDTDDSKKVRWNITVKSHYEDLIIDYTLEAYNSSEGSYQEVAYYQDVYQGEETSKLAIPTVTNNAYSIPGDRAVLDNKMLYDGKFDDPRNLTAVIIYPDNGVFEKLEAPGTSYQEWSTNFQYVKSQLQDANVSEDVIFNDSEGKKLKAFNLTAPADSNQYIGSTVSIPENSSGNSYMYLLGSGSGFATDYSVGGSDFDYGKQLNITTATGNPTVGSKAYPVHIINGSSTNTGTGNITVPFQQFGSSDCSDLRFVNETDNGELNFEIEECDFSTGDSDGIKEIWAWVHIPEAVRDGNDEIHMYWGNKSSVSNASDPSGTWGNSGQSLNGVYHDPSATSDSSPDGNDLTVSSVTQVPGQFGEAGDYDGSTSESDTPTNTWSELSGNFTVVSWIKTSVSSGEYAVLGSRDSDSGHDFHFRFKDGDLELIQYDGSSYNVKPTNSYNDGNWHTVVQRQNNDADESELLVDTNSEGTARSGNLTLEQEKWGIGYRSGDGGQDKHIDAAIDEVRFYQGQYVSDDELQADFDASPAGSQTFFSQTKVEQQSGSDTNPPSITIDSPKNQSYSKTSIDLNVTADETVDTWKRSLDGAANVTFNPNASLTSLSDGGHTVTVYANDSSGNLAKNSVSFTVDTSEPLVSINPSTTSSGTIRKSWIFLNISATDSLSGLDFVRESFDGTNTTFANNANSNYWENHTGLADATYEIWGWANDTAGNFNKTKLRTITVDTPTASTKKFVVDTASDWSQGTFTNTQEVSELLKLKYGDNPDGDNDTLIENESDGSLYIYDYTDNTTHSLGITPQSLDNPGDIEDIDDDGDKEATYMDNGNLKYYEFTSDSKTDTSVGIDAIGPVIDTDSDSKNEQVVALSSSDNLAYYDFADDSTTDLGVSADSIGFQGDVNSDGDIDVPYSDSEDFYYYDFAADTSKVIITLSGTDTGKEAFEIYDWDDDSNKDLLYHDGESSERLRYVEIDLGDNTSQTTSVYNAHASEIAAIDGSGGEDFFYTEFNGDNYLSNYDFGLSSSSRVTTFQTDKLGGVGDLGYSSDGRYITKTFDANDRYVWKNVTLGGLSRPGSSSVNMTVETSSDSFSTINETKTFQDADLTDGTNTYTFDLNNGTQYVRVKIWLIEGSTPEVDNITIQGNIYNDPPTFKDTELYWQNIGGAESTRVNYTVTDPNGNENADANDEKLPNDASVFKFSNTTYSVDTGLTFDYIPTVTDFIGEVGKGLETNYTLTKKLYVENQTGVFNTTEQAINTSVWIENRGGQINYTVSDSTPGTLIQTVVDGDTSKDNLASNNKDYINWQYRVDRISNKTFSEEKDTAQTSTIDTQYLEKNHQIDNNISTDFSSVAVDPVSFNTFSCTDCGSDKNIAVNGNSKANATFHASGDAITSEKEFSFDPATDEVTLGVDYIGKRNFQADETQGFTWNNIDITGNVTEPGYCNQNNNSQVTVSASTFENYTVGFNCDPGDKGNPTQEITNLTDGDERVWYNSTDMNITTNRTEETRVAIKADKDNTKNPDQRDGGSLEAYVEGVSSNGNNELNVSDTGSFFRIEVSTSFQTSSLHTTDTDWSVTYTLSGDSTTPSNGGGGGGGGGGGDDFDPSFQYESTNHEVIFGRRNTREFKVVNLEPAENTVNLERSSNQGFCQYVTIQKSIQSQEFGTSAVYTLGSSQNEPANQKFVDVRYDVPNQSVLNEQGIADYTCKFTATSDIGEPEDLVLSAESTKSFIERFLNFLENLGLESKNYCVPNTENESITGQFSTSLSFAQEGVCQGKLTRGPSPVILLGLFIAVPVGLGVFFLGGRGLKNTVPVVGG